MTTRPAKCITTIVTRRRIQMILRSTLPADPLGSILVAAVAVLSGTSVVAAVAATTLVDPLGSASDG